MVKKNDEHIGVIDLESLDLCCGKCIPDLEGKLRNIKGVKKVEVFSSAQKVRMTYGLEETQPTDILTAVKDLVYQAKLSTEHTETCESKSRPTNVIRLTFLFIVAGIVLVEILFERVGLWKIVLPSIPSPILIAAILVGGYPIFKNAILGFKSRKINIDTMMTVGILAAATIGEFSSALLIVFFMNIAHYVENFTVNRSRKAIKELIKMTPKTARVLKDGEEIEVSIEEIKYGDTAIVKPGERIPVDGRVLSGHSVVDQSPITGESISVEKHKDDYVFAATINQAGALRIEVDRVGKDSTFGKIVRLVEGAEASKANVQKFADKFTTYFLPAVIGIAILTFLISRNPLFSIAVLVAACPCAVGLATPLSVVASAGASAKKGLLIKGGLYLENLAKVNAVVVDKTGTLTLGKPKITDIVSFSDLTQADILRVAASVERYSEHPLASAIIHDAKEQGLVLDDLESFEVDVGRGVVGILKGKAYLLGNRKLLDEKGISVTETLAEVQRLESEGKTVLYLCEELKPVAAIAVADVLRSDVPNAIKELKKLGIKRIILLTGDNERVASAVAKTLEIPQYKSNLKPEDKITEVKRLQAEGYKVLMIGDGINDAPALAQADVGLAMGIAGTDIAIEAAHGALTRDDWKMVPLSIRIGRKTYKTIKQNIVLGIAWNIITLSLASVGILPIMLAAASEAVPDVLIAVNSSKLLRPPR